MKLLDENVFKALK